MNSNHQERRGRPRVKGKQESEKCSSVLAIQQAILLYLHQIGLPKGIVFRSQERKGLISEGLLKWNENYEWEKDKESKKCRNILEKKFKLKKGVRNMNLIELVEMMTQISDIFCQEATEEVYQIFGNILVSVANRSEINIREIWQKLVFLNRQFTSKKIKYYVVDDHPQMEMFENFTQLIFKLRQIVENTCENPEEWRASFEYEKNIDIQLEKIAQNKH